MILHLTFRGYGIGLDLPTTHDNAASTISRLKEGFEDEPAQVSISGVNGPVSNLYPYIQHTDLECWDDLQKLNTLAEQIGSMGAGTGMYRRSGRCNTHCGWSGAV